MSYNPFDKRLGARLAPEDLQCLVTRRVAEGYYVEYKSAPNTNEKIGRTLASFANTHGGWYFIGVRTDANHVAAAIDGFRIDAWHDPIARIRDIGKTHVDPTPVIFPQLVDLGGGLGVAVVYIPDDQVTPFLTKDGRMYRRVVDSSDPIYETDRHALDQLVERGAKRRRRFSEFAQDRRTFSKAEENMGWLNIYISPHPFGTIERRDIFNIDTIAPLIEKSRRPVTIPLSRTGDSRFSGNVPFTAGQPTSDSVILRQSAPLRDAFNSLTLELDEYGRAKILVPINHASGEDAWSLDRIASPRARDVVKSAILGDVGQAHLLHRCNMEGLWLSVACLVSYYLDWLGRQDALTGYDFAIDLKAVWRFVPFFDFDSWGEHVGRFGLPVVTNEEIRIPGEPDRALFYRCDSPLPLWLHVCLETSLAFGLPREIFSENLVATIFKACEKGKSQDVRQLG